jgi:hypothetical protein
LPDNKSAKNIAKSLVLLYNTIYKVRAAGVLVMENVTLTKDNIQLIEKIINSHGMASAVVKIEGRKIIVLKEHRQKMA